MKKIASIISKSVVAASLAAIAMPTTLSAAEVEGWGDFKLYIDPGHSCRENQGLWGYSEAEKTLRVAKGVQDYLITYTDFKPENIKLCRYDDNTTISLEERSDEANAWGADFYYSIHSDAGNVENTNVTLFGGWRKNGVEIEKTPNGGKAFGEFLCPNQAGIMRINTRGNWYDRCFYDRTPETHTNQYPYLSVNRRSHMPSLLSEGGYHTVASQQSRNINEDYKRLEALAAFHALLSYKGLPFPATTMLTGVVRNSETGEALNGATITVGDRTYTTDTWASVFYKYSNNPDLIHNGFYVFEGLKGEVEVTFACPGFESKTETVTIKEGTSNSSTVDYVTFLDVDLVNVAPAKVSSINKDNLDAVTPLEPLIITFSRGMDRESVENAFSISGNGKVELAWKNDYTLKVELDQLLPEWDYTIKIDGSIARNSQTGQLLDGDGDGVEGGDYTLSFTMAEPDTEAPYIINTTPADGGAAVYTLRPVVGIEFNEEVKWDENANADFMTVTDAQDNVYPGRVTHAVVNGKSFLQYYFESDLPLDKAFLVTVKAGVEDLYGNAAEAMHFRFLSEYRGRTAYTTIHDLNTTANFWAPGGSGSTKGIINEESTVAKSNITSSIDADNTGSMRMSYVFDMSASTPLWIIREYWASSTSNPINDINVVLTAWVYGDASNNTIGMRCRCNSKSGGIKMRDPEFTIDWRGWRLIHWDMANDDWNSFTGTDKVGAPFYFDSFFMTHEDIDPDDEEIPFQEWEGAINFDELGYSKWDEENFQREASIDDVKIPESGVAVVKDFNGAIRLYGGEVHVITPATVNSVKVYDVAGALVAASKTAKVNVSNLPAGVYVVKASTAAGNLTAKVAK